MRRLLRGVDTVLGDAASDWELFVSEESECRTTSDISRVLKVQRLNRTCGPQERLANFKVGTPGRES